MAINEKHINESIEHAVLAKTDFARMLGISLRTFERRVSDGTLIPVERPHKGSRKQRFALCANMRRYLAHLDARNEHSSKASEHKQEMLRHDAEIKQSKAVILEMEVRQLQMKMHDATDVQALTADLIDTIREALLSFPEKATAAVWSLPAPRDPNEVADVLRKEVYSIMAGLANYQFDGRRIQEKMKKIKEVVDVGSADRNAAAQAIK